MRAAVMYGAGDVRVEDVRDAHLGEPTDALVRVTRAAICGSDLWPYKSMEPADVGRPMGHEFIGVVEAVGAEVRTVKTGDLVVSPFLWSDGTCVFCREGLHSECLHGGRYGFDEVDGGQGEAVRVSQADGTLVVLSVGADDELMPSLLTLTDVMGTGHHAALAAQVGPGKTVAVIGDGAVGLCGVIASKRLGADAIILLGRNPERTALGEEFGATDVVPERSEDAVERIRELTQHGAHSVLECVGLDEAVETRARGPSRRCDRSRRRARARDDADRRRVLEERFDRRWPRARAGVYRGAAAGCARTSDRAGPRLRPHRVDRGRPRRLPRDERPRSPEVPDQAVEGDR
jgi:threonine dehydrogenase-like Zn-dependent dehydrogenase